jgi:S-adenosylmethionine:tRNA ribosyltransferase-isomerase
MHAEVVSISRPFLEFWKTRTSGLIAVGTTTTRSLESLYWLGVRMLAGIPSDPEQLAFNQWENESLPDRVSVEESLDAILAFLETHQLEEVRFSTSLMIVPGYKFRTIEGLVTNFHLPGSTLLLLIAALIGDDWRRVYEYALIHGFRFLSYGDSSLLLPRKR